MKKRNFRNKIKSGMDYRARMVRQKEKRWENRIVDPIWGSSICREFTAHKNEYKLPLLEFSHDIKSWKKRLFSARKKEIRETRLRKSNAQRLRRDLSYVRLSKYLGLKK